MDEQNLIGISGAILDNYGGSYPYLYLSDGDDCAVILCAETDVATSPRDESTIFDYISLTRVKWRPRDVVSFNIEPNGCDAAEQTILREGRDIPTQVIRNAEGLATGTSVSYPFLFVTLQRPLRRTLGHRTTQGKGGADAIVANAPDVLPDDDYYSQGFYARSRRCLNRSASPQRHQHRVVILSAALWMSPTPSS